MASDGGANVRVMTWNIHGGRRLFGRGDLGRVVEIVKRHQPDIVALQEVDSRRSGIVSEPAFEFLANTLGSHCAEARLITAVDGDYGHALISRWPLNGTVSHDVSTDGREPRAAIETTVETPFGELHVVAAHLGLSFSERRHQAARLASVAHPEGPAIVLGDFNDWFLDRAVRRALDACMAARTQHKTFPAWLPAFALDRVYCKPADILVGSWTDPSAHKVSDHLPVIAELALRTEPPRPPGQEPVDRSAASLATA